jgi:hypothetical protein
MKPSASVDTSRVENTEVNVDEIGGGAPGLWGDGVTVIVRI